MAYLCDDVKPRETKGANRSPAVDAIILGNGGELGQSWCAHSVGFCCRVADVAAPQWSGAVSEWRQWADANGKLREWGGRGLLCFKKSDGVSHIGICVESVNLGGTTFIRSIEGNTSNIENGSQDNGEGMYRQQRREDWWDGFIEL